MKIGLQGTLRETLMLIRLSRLQVFPEVGWWTVGRVENTHRGGGRQAGGGSCRQVEQDKLMIFFLIITR